MPEKGIILDFCCLKTLRPMISDPERNLSRDFLQMFPSSAFTNLQLTLQSLYSSHLGDAPKRRSHSFLLWAWGLGKLLFSFQLAKFCICYPFSQYLVIYLGFWKWLFCYLNGILEEENIHLYLQSTIFTRNLLQHYSSYKCNKIITHRSINAST